MDSVKTDRVDSDEGDDGSEEEEEEEEGEEGGDGGDGEDGDAAEDQVPSEGEKGQRRSEEGSRLDQDGTSEASHPTKAKLSKSPSERRSTSPAGRFHSDSASSRSPSPTLDEQTASLSLSTSHHADIIREKAAVDVSKHQAQQQRKFHSKRGAHRAGRPKGSKGKQDTRIKLDRGGMWD